MFSSSNKNTFYVAFYVQSRSKLENTILRDFYLRLPVTSLSVLPVLNIWLTDHFCSARKHNSKGGGRGGGTLSEYIYINFTEKTQRDSGKNLSSMNNKAQLNFILTFNSLLLCYHFPRTVVKGKRKNTNMTNFDVLSTLLALFLPLSKHLPFPLRVHIYFLFFFLIHTQTV